MIGWLIVGGVAVGLFLWSRTKQAVPSSPLTFPAQKEYSSSSSAFPDAERLLDFGPIPLHPGDDLVFKFLVTPTDMAESEVLSLLSTFGPAFEKSTLREVKRTAQRASLTGSNGERFFDVWLVRGKMRLTMKPVTWTPELLAKEIYGSPDPSMSGVRALAVWLYKASIEGKQGAVPFDARGV